MDSSSVVFPLPFGSDEGDLLAALDGEARVLEQRLVAGVQRDALRLQDDAPGARRREEVEAERPSLARERLVLADRALALLLQAPDLRQLGLRLLRLRLLVPEALHEPLEARDVDGHALGRPRRGRCALCLLAPPLVPRAGEVVGAARRELEDGGRDGLEEPAVVRHEDHGRVERLQLALEPLEALDVEVVRRLVEQQQVGIAGERTCERRARQLAAREGVQLPVEIRLDEAEAADRRRDPVAPGPAAAVLELRLRVGIAAKRRVVVRAALPWLPRGGEAPTRARAGPSRPRARTRGA